MLSCCTLTKYTDIARRAVDQFHQELETGQDDAIYDRADPEYKEAMTRDANQRLFSRIREKLGPVKKTESIGYFVDESTRGTFVKLHYKTHCANGELDERFWWRIKRTQALLIRYEARSPLLSTE